MSAESCKAAYERRKSEISADYRLAGGLAVKERKTLFGIEMDIESNGHNVKKQLKCTISSCFDKNNTCCKACDIRKKCRFRCNFLDMEECPHQKLD